MEKWKCVKEWIWAGLGMKQFPWRKWFQGECPAHVGTQHSDLIPDALPMSSVCICYVVANACVPLGTLFCVIPATNKLYACVVDMEDNLVRKSDGGFSAAEYFQFPERYASTFSHKVCWPFRCKLWNVIIKLCQWCLIVKRKGRKKGKKRRKLHGFRWRFSTVIKSLH